MVNIIAVVTSVNPEKKTRTGGQWRTCSVLAENNQPLLVEWSRSFTVTDPSKFEATPNGTTVTCFQKKYLEWLPQVKQHDVVILRKLRVRLWQSLRKRCVLISIVASFQIAEFNGESKATGFSDKLRWAVYDPNTHWIQPPIKGDAPEKEALDDGLSYEFSPYWEPIQDSVELHYCRRIVEWWKPLQEHRDRNVTTVQCSGAARKQHLLISQASPDLPPNGFFKCTVEVSTA
jgi:hypothetical protein